MSVTRCHHQRRAKTTVCACATTSKRAKGVRVGRGRDWRRQNVPVNHESKGGTVPGEPSTQNIMGLTVTRGGQDHRGKMLVVRKGHSYRRPKCRVSRSLAKAALHPSATKPRITRWQHCVPCPIMSVNRHHHGNPMSLIDPSRLAIPIGR